MAKRAAIKSKTRQKGVALLTALLLVALVTILTVNLQWDTRLDIRRSENLFASDQALLYALGAEAWASEILQADARDSVTDHTGEDWATPVPTLPIEGGAIRGFLEDMQGRFNLNNLVDRGRQVDEGALEQFERLLTVLELDPALARITVDWLDRDLEPGFPSGAEDSFYTARIPPYRTANLAITSASEIMAIGEMDAASFHILAPYVTALPNGTALNVNTASAPVLRSLSDQISDTVAENLIGERGDQGFDGLAAFADLVEPEIMQSLELSSSFFRLTADVSIGSTRFTLYSLLERNNGQLMPVMRTYNSE
ncbi:MAG: type II secretion system minor pseudopilin GspK [Proteobacteria bacterium]|nr:type II secretion system minor pseudopilin GspK [Pseudomonadota bacterium]